MKIKALVVDDEPISVEILCQYIDDLCQIEYIGSCSNALEAIEILKTKNVDCIFLDINMPKLSGINFIKTISNPPLVVFVSAYPEYAVQGFEVEAVDYLLKPFSFERFVKAVNKISDRLSLQIASPSKASILIKDGKKLYNILLDDIIYFTATGDYVKVHLAEKILITNDTLKNISRQLSPDQFIRIHKSHLVALKQIKFVEGNRVRINDGYLPIGQTYKEALINRLQS